MKEKYNEFLSTPVAIPMIQRDYVQGADINSEKRDRFLLSIFDYLADENCKDYEIDFIYGSSDEKESNSCFQPIDGQQRLTTLALIAWSLNNKTYGRYSNFLPCLTYFTRPSTEQFLENLFKYRINGEYITVSEHLKTIPGWFTRNWLCDPSINAMLEMLDRIDTILADSKYFTSLEKIAYRFFNDSPIIFERLDMRDLKLGDDLYIKMNARGKKLSPFENWKAGFEGILAKNYSKMLYEQGRIPGIEAIPSAYDYFVYAIEHDWCDLLWPNSFKRWSNQSEEERKRVTYPRIDEDFMRILDFVSHFIFFSQTEEYEPKREHFDKSRDDAREEIYRKSKENIETLFKVFDVFVKISHSKGGISGFFDKIFTRTYDRQQMRVNLFEEIPHVNLYELCLSDKLNYSSEIMLWAVLQYIFYHPDAINNPDDNMRDYLRIVMGWICTLRQRLIEGLNVSRNIRLSDFKEAAEIIERLASTKNLFNELSSTTQNSLSAERRKATYISSGKYDIVRVLSTCPELYYCFSLLFDSMDAATSVDDYINRFEEFMQMDDINRIRSLVIYCYCGVPTMRNHYFYGLQGHWDFLFTISKDDSGWDNCCKSFTNWMLANPSSDIINDNSKFEYYIYHYDEFINAVLPDKLPLHYFIRDAESSYVAWAVKTMSTRPIMGYNVDPFGFTVSKRAKINSPNYNLWDNSYYGESGVLYLQDNSEAKDALRAQCISLGWQIEIVDRRFSCIKKLKERFHEGVDKFGNPTLNDTQNVFKFKGMILLDTPGKDRIQNMIAFIEAFA